MVFLEQGPQNLVGGKIIKGISNSIILPNSIRLPGKAVLIKEGHAEEKLKWSKVNSVEI